MFRTILTATVGLLLATSVAVTQNLTPRSIPPHGVAIPANDRKELETGLASLESAIKGFAQGSPLLPDIAVCSEAVRMALTYDEFFRPEDVGKAKEILRVGMSRAMELRSGRATWPTKTGLIIRGYVSRIDRSIQPYGLVVPPTFDPNLPRRWRLDVWLHGRAETLNEVSFLYDRQRSAGEFAPEDTIVLHTYGRYNNANKFAGEIDVFEAIDAVKRAYRIDENRILVRGFSMGGAATWHLAAHHAGLWAAAAPGAGFAETPEYTKIMQDTEKPTWWQQKLWHLYNATDYAANLANTALVAYSGEIDPQKQAADIMAKAMAAEGMRLTHIIGPNTPHRYHPDSKLVISQLVDKIAERGRDPYPKAVHFTTWTLRYNRTKWITIDGLDKHWERARIDAEITSDNSIRIKSQNVSAFSLDMGPGAALLRPAANINVIVNGQTLSVPGPMSDQSFSASVLRTGANHWMLANPASQGSLRKRHGLQGPVDDAFYDSFIFVRPTGQPMNEAAGKWTQSELARAEREWRRHFRGEPQIRDDSAVSANEIANANLILWGDPSSNQLLAKIISQLPIHWSRSQLGTGTQRYAAASHIPILIYPNPLNPERYVVLNSGFTWREADYLTNAREVPKLPDWAVVDISTPPDARWPGKIVSAGFFDEQWRLVAAGK